MNRIRYMIANIMLRLDENPDGYAATTLYRDLDLTMDEYSGILTGLERSKYIVVNAHWILITNEGKEFCKSLQAAI